MSCRSTRETPPDVIVSDFAARSTAEQPLRLSSVVSRSLKSGLIQPCLHVLPVHRSEAGRINVKTLGAKSCTHVLRHKSLIQLGTN